MGEEHLDKGTSGHNGAQVSLVLLTTLLFLAAAAMMHLFFFPEYAADLFKVELRNLTFQYEIPVTPSHWTYLLVPIITAWLLLAKAYALVLLCRHNAVGPAYKSPPVLTHWALLPYSLACLALVAWTVVFDREQLIAATALMAAAALLLWLATAALYQSVHHHGPWLARHSAADLWLYRILWHNGLAALTTYASVQAAYLLGVCLRVEVGLSLQEVVYVVLGIVAGIMVLWFLLESTVLDRYGRYTVTHYLVVLTVTGGAYERQFAVTDEPTQYFIIALLAASAVCAVLRVSLAIGRGVKCPLYSDNKIHEDPVLGYAD